MDDVIYVVCARHGFDVALIRAFDVEEDAQKLRDTLEAHGDKDKTYYYTPVPFPL